MDSESSENGQDESGLRSTVSPCCGILICSEGPLSLASVRGAADDQTDSDGMETVVMK